MDRLNKHLIRACIAAAVLVALAASLVDASPLLQKPLMEIVDLNLSSSEVRVGEMVEVRAELANVGQVPLENVFVTAASTTEDMEVITTSGREFELIEPGQEITFTAEVRLLSPGQHQLGILVTSKDFGLEPQGLPIRVIGEAQVPLRSRVPWNLLVVSGLLFLLVFPPVVGRWRGLYSDPDICPAAAIFLTLLVLHLPLSWFLPRWPSEEQMRLLFLFYYPLRILVPPLIILLGRRWVKPAVLPYVALAPFLLLALFELPRLSPSAVFSEYLLLGGILALMGVGAGLWPRRREWGLFLVLLGGIFWAGAYREAILGSVLPAIQSVLPG